ncbi:MAG: hypothetical protein AABZ14_03560 [Candidatus Margulisiibacteriota bacterium]
MALGTVQYFEKRFGRDHVAGLQVEFGEEFIFETSLHQRLEFLGTKGAEDGLVLDVDHNAISPLKKIVGQIRSVP